MRRGPTSILAFLLLAAPAVAPRSAELAAGQSLVEAIAALEDGGLVVYYSSDLVRPDMRVLAEPLADESAAALDEILAPHGLTTRPGPDDSRLVVRQDGAGAAQPGSILGVLRDAHTRRRISGARLTIVETGDRQQSSAAGHFHFVGLAPGRYTLSVAATSHTGPVARAVEVASGETTLLDLGVEDPGVAALAKVVVSASRFELAGERAATFRYLPVEHVEQLPDLGDDPLRALTHLPGTSTGGFTARSHLRGGAEDEVLYVFDGIRLRDPFHLRDYQGLFSAIDPAILGGLDVYTGGLPARYGDRMSGVVSISPMAPPAARYHELSLSLFNASALTAGSLDDGRVDWVASGRRGNLDRILDLTDPTLGDPTYSDFYARLGVQATPGLRVTGSVLLFDDRIRLSDSDQEENASGSYRDRYFWLRMDHELDDGLRGTTLFSHTGLDSLRRGTVDKDGVSHGSLEDERDFTVDTLQSEWSWWAADRLQFIAGGEASRADGDYDYRDDVEYDVLFLAPGAPRQMTRSRDIRLRPSGRRYALYGSSRLGFGEHAVAELGLRWDRETLTSGGHDTLSPRLGVMWPLRPETVLRANASRHYQSQSIDELPVSDGVTAYADPQRADHFVLGVDQQLPGEIALRLEGWWKEFGHLRPRFENLLNTRVLLPELRPDRLRVAPDGARAQGVELSVSRFHAGELNWWLSYEWSQVRDDIDGDEVPRSWDQAQAARAGLQWEHGRWSASLAGTWHTGWPATHVFLADAGELPLLGTGPRNGERYGEFFSLDVRLAHEWRFPGSTLTGFIEVVNLTSRRNECCVEFEYEDEDEDEGDAGLDLQTLHYLEIFPSLGVTWRFGDRGGG